jgi:transposase
MDYNALISETEDELKELEKRQKLVQFQKRIHFLWCLKSGAAQTQQLAGEQVGWKLRYSQSMWKLYRDGGITKLADVPRRYRLAKLSSCEIARLQSYLREFGASSLDEMGNYIRTAFGVSYTRGGLSLFCRRMRIKLKTARPSNERKDEAQVAAYKKTLAS